MPKPFKALLLLFSAFLVAPSEAHARTQLFGQAPVPAASKAPTPAPPQGPTLEPGEGFAIAMTDGTGVQVFGEGRREGPMGSLAKLVWIKLEESEWSSRMLLYTCTGKVNGETCGPPKGHGRIDLTKALQVDCHHAFHAWVQISAAVWKETYGSGGARTRLEEAFGPFLGQRMPPGNDLPELTAAWIGQGDLFRTSPEAFVRWLADPAQESLLDQAKRNFNHFFSDSKWWFHAGTAPVPGESIKTSAWVAGSDGNRVFALSLPPGKTRTEALARIKLILGLGKK